MQRDRRIPKKSHNSNLNHLRRCCEAKGNFVFTHNKTLTGFDAESTVLWLMFNLTTLPSVNTSAVKLSPPTRKAMWEAFEYVFGKQFCDN